MSPKSEREIHEAMLEKMSDVTSGSIWLDKRGSGMGHVMVVSKNIKWVESQNRWMVYVHLLKAHKTVWIDFDIYEIISRKWHDFFVRQADGTQQP